MAWRLKDGRAIEGISLDEAAKIARAAGLQVPPPVQQVPLQAEPEQQQQPEAEQEPEWEQPAAEY